MLLGNLPHYSQAFRSEARTASLYSDFRSQKSSNPDGYIANCQAWVQAICAAADSGDLPAGSRGQADHYILHPGEHLTTALSSPKYGRPLALDEAFAYGIEEGKLMSLQEYTSRETSIFAKSRIPTMGQIVGWGLKRAGLAGRSIPRDLVNIEGLEEAGYIVAERSSSLSSEASRIMNKELFVDCFKESLPKIGQDDFNVLMLFLSRDRGIIAYDAATTTIKFAGNTAAHPEISQEDKDIASLRSLMLAMQKQVTNLTDRVARLDQDVRSFVIAKNNAAAKNALRFKKLTESTLQQRTATVHQLEDTYAKIEQAADQVEIVSVMEAAARTLKTLNERTGGIDRIQDIMDDLKEQAMDTDEITQALNENNNNAIDEVEIEDELAALEQVEQKKTEDAQQAQNVADQAAKEAKIEQEAEDLRVRLAALESPSKADPKHAANEKSTVLESG